ncbi:MAG TPA: S-methyl-5-thioribose-1-phosphate isomerase [Gemmatimonadales bacterium]|nr:S-methyl-5-thioribose-1-phosphate isomerase [Gemmatimonadales bacterium]
MELRHLAWASGHRVRILDQSALPREERHLELATVEQVAEAIERLRVRGAPLIGIVAAMGVVQALRGDEPRAEAMDAVRRACERLRATRPTAVNLAWALERTARRAARTPGDGAAIRAALIAEADAIWAEDREMCHRLGRVGAALVPDGAVVHTHCNAGALATGGIGTALAPIYLAHAAGRRVRVIVGETRPVLQGSRLTMWELARAGIPCTLIADAAAASRLARGDVSCVIVGADRVAMNGDVANKVGTYALALAARAHGVPFYVALPRSTLDPAAASGAAIPIEERGRDELLDPAGWRALGEVAAAWNPAFDVTPAELVTGFITDCGVLAPAELARLVG